MKATALGSLLGLLALLLGAELLCRLLPVSSATKADYRVDPDILSYAPHHAWRYATGWDLRNPQHLTTNGHGFVSDHEFVRDTRAIAFIGDSYVESASLDAADRPAAQLERALGGGRPVYAMGGAGTSLLDYAERIRWAHDAFGIRDFVVLMERGDVMQSFCGSGNVASRCLDRTSFEPRIERAPSASAAKRVLRESAFAQYLFSQLKIAPASLLQKAFTRSVPEPAGVDRDRGAPVVPAAADSARAGAAVDAVAAAFFARIAPYADGRLVIVVDADRHALAAGRPADDPARRRFIERARAGGATVVDTEPLFAAHFARSKLSLDLGPADGHFNPLGTRLVAAAAAQAYAQAPNRGPMP